MRSTNHLTYSALRSENEKNTGLFNFAFMEKLKMHWRTLVGLVLVYAAAVFSLSWVWGILFLFWVVPDLISGVTYFISEVNRKTAPVLYWFIMATWILMSAYVLAEPFFPPSWQSESYTSSQSSYSNSTPDLAGIPIFGRGDEPARAPVLAEGNYKDILIPPATPALDSSDTPSETTANGAVIPEDSIVIPDTLKYKHFAAEAMNFVGVEIQTTYINDQYEQDLEEQWTYFFSEDISVVIPDIIDERLYVVYYDYDQPEEGTFKTMIGYRTEKIGEVYEGLKGITVPKSDFAVLASDSEPESFVEQAWMWVEASNLDRAHSFDLEVYQLDEKTYEVTHAEIRVSINR